MSIVFLSSIAGIRSSCDLPIDYHILKGISSLIPHQLSNHLLALNARINTIVLGEFQKYSIHEYTRFEQEKFKLLEELFNNKCVNPDDVSSLIKFLLSNESGCLTGQTLTLDNAASVLSVESVLRSYPRG